MDNRQFRTKGEVLRLGGLSCTIQSVEGSGGSAVVYRAFYQDAVSSGLLHHVLLKEFYPWTADGAVYRDVDGWIRCTDAGRRLFARGAQGFLDGNEANLKLLARMPEQISGNLNTYEAYGTYYTLLPVHGGENLQRVLEEDGRSLTLREITQITIRILDALKCFHECGLLHLDISPDNVLLLKSCAMLIDYNSVWPMDGDTESFRFSRKEGYTPPEIRLQEIGSIGPASDLYSVAAVLYRMLTGRILTGEEMDGLRPIGDLTKEQPVFSQEPASAVSLMIRIARRGLHVLAKKRYPEIRSMKADLEEVLLRLDQKGITHASLWEGSRLEYRKQCAKQETDYLHRRVRMEGTPIAAISTAGTANLHRRVRVEGDGAIDYLPGQKDDRRVRTEGTGDPDHGIDRVEERTEEEILRGLAEGSCILLTGIGGMGKTCLLRQLWGLGVRSFSERTPVVFYIPLSGWRTDGQDGQYIRRTLLRHLNLTRQDTMDGALQELNRMLDPSPVGEQCKMPPRRWIFLLDGLNEAGPHAEKLLREVEELGRLRDVGILVTDRTADVLRYALKGFQTAQLLPLTEETVRETLAKRGLALPADTELLQALTNPMMLSLYGRIREMEQDADGVCGTPDSAACGSMQGMIDCYMDALCTAQMRRDSGSRTEQEKHTYLLRHLLPQIALRAGKQEGHVLSAAEMAALAQADYDTLRSKTFSAAFPEYTGKSRLILDGIRDGREWFDYAVNEELAGRFGLLEKRVLDSGGRMQEAYAFAHDNFLECLAVHGRRRQETLQRVRRRGVLKRVVPAAACAAVLLFVLIRFLPHDLTEAEQKLFNEAAYQLETNTYVVNDQLNTALAFLDEADSYVTADGQPDAAQIGSAAAYVLSGTGNSCEKFYVDTDAYITALADRFAADVPEAVLKELLYEPEELQIFLEEELLLLQERAADGSAQEIAEDADALTVYLEAYTVWYYLEYNEVLLAFGEAGADDAAGELTDYMNDSGTAFTDCKTYYSLGTMSEEALADAQKTAEDALARAGASLPQ